VKQIAPTARAIPMVFTFIHEYERPACGFIPVYLDGWTKFIFGNKTVERFLSPARR
jgi:hypothetical protein